MTSIPLDTEFEEIRDVFSKCGVIAEEIDSGRPRIKMYMDDEGNFKGEALVVYFRPESVNLAIQMLDDTNFRLGVPGPQGPMKVQVADFSFKSQQDAPPKASMKDRRKIIQRTQRLNKYVLPVATRPTQSSDAQGIANSPIGMTTIRPPCPKPTPDSKRLSS